MKNRMKWLSEYKDFLEGEPSSPPRSLEQTLFEKVHQELNPSKLMVFWRLLVIHLFAGSLTLFVCPQFGVGPIGGWFDLMAALMPYGVIVCATACGSLYFGVTALTSQWVLSPEILSALNKSRFQQFGSLAALSLAVLMVLTGAFGTPLPELSFILVWLVAGIGVSQGIFHGLFRLRHQSANPT